MNEQSAIIQFIPLLVASIPFAIGNWYLAPRLGKNAFLWVILSLIPLVNFFFGVYVAYQVIFGILDQMKATLAAHRATAE